MADRDANKEALDQVEHATDSESALPGWDLRPISSRAAISDIRISDEAKSILA